MPVKKKKNGAGSGLDFNHAMIYVRDLAAGKHFYGDLLGFKLVDEFKWQDRPVYARLRPPNGTCTIALHLAEPGRAVESPGVRLYFEVKALEAFCKKLEAAGVTLTKQPEMMPWGWKHAYLNDPDGHEVSLYWAGAKRFRKTTLAIPKEAGTR